MKWDSRVSTLFALLVIATCSEFWGQGLKVDKWAEDFKQLKLELSAQYANLEWAVEARGLDLKQLSEQTESRLAHADNDADARKVIESFLDAFGDGHLSIVWAQNKATSPADDAPANSPLPLCERLGYQTNNQPPRVDFARLGNFKEISTDDSKYFPIGILAVGARKDVGVLRIPIFSERAYPNLCERAAEHLRLTKDSPCDEQCEETVERRAADLLTAALGRQAEVLKRSRIDVLLVDITGNGGGTNWTEAAARTLSAKPLRSPRQRFIRHEHWARQLKRRLEVVEADLRGSAPPDRELLLRAENVLRAAIAETRKVCNRGAVWENRKPGCTIVADTPELYPQSVMPHARPDSLRDRPSSRFLFYPSRYAYREGVYAGRLIVLVDNGTWSSAEYFAAMLRDNGAATIIGAPTGGAGCGYTEGGIRTYLKNSGARVKIPDCVRLRSDGTNEVEGVTPDMPVPWRPNDNRYQRATRVSATLSDHLDSKSKNLSRIRN